MERDKIRKSSPVTAAKAEPGESNDSRRASMPQLQTKLSRASGLASQITPPLTPSSANDEASNGSLFHNYLRAFHPFDPKSINGSDDEASSITVSIKQGDLILVHSVHANGWADGTLLTTGERGWLPTNYCEPYDHPHIRNLLNAMTQFWDLLGANEDANLSTFLKQDYVRGLIAGVRYLLEHAKCLHRDAPLVKRHVGVRRMRKGLLADLSTLVQKAKEMQQTISECYAGEVVHVLLDELVAKAFKVVMRAVKFVDIWAQETSNDDQTPSAHSADPSTPPVDIDGLAIDVTAAKQGVSPTVDSAKCFSQELQDSRRSQDEQSRLPPSSPRPLSTIFDAPAETLSRRLSLVKVVPMQDHGLASVQLAKAHDACISHIGTFLGHHLQSRTPSELAHATDRLASACRTMLSIVDEVISHDTQRTVSVQQAKIHFQAKLEDLIKSTREVFTFSDIPDDEVVMLPQQSSHLVLVGTNLIRTAGECVAKTRSLIEQIGDFKLQEVRVPLDIESEKSGRTSHESQCQAEGGALSPRKRTSGKMLPPPPPVRQRADTTETTDFARPSTAKSDSAASNTTYSSEQQKSLPPPLQRRSTRFSQSTAQLGEALQSPRFKRGHSVSPARKDSVGISVNGSMTGSIETYQSSARDSEFSATSEASTRATTPDHAKEPRSPNPALLNSFSSLASIRSVATDVSSEAEAQLLQKTHAHELMLNQDGQVIGGSMPALIEQMTTHENTPDPQFMTAFYVTFRLFTTPRQLAQTLIDRFDDVGDNKLVATPVRLRIYNVFKGWLETYWNAEADREALGEIRYFALHKLKMQMPSVAERLLELTRKVTAAYSNGTITGPLVSGVGKTSTSLGTQYERGSSTPEPIANKQQMNALRMALTGSAPCSILDFEPLELARQLTLVTSKIFCDIHPEELLGLAWSKAKDKAPNVRKICNLNTQISLVVSDTILAPEDPKKRAQVIKQWIKIAMHCMELRNYESLMAIVGALNTSIVQRLKRTWEIVSKKTKARFDELNAVVDLSHNYKSLRSKVETPVAPCLPFLGIYLTDLTFTDAGNPNVKDLPGSASGTGGPVSVINFDKYARMAKIIGHIQKFQVVYKLQAVPEMQDWLQNYLRSMGDGSGDAVQKFHRRSQVLEPKLVDDPRIPQIPYDRKVGDSAGVNDRPKTSSSRHESARTFLRSNTFGFKHGGGSGAVVVVESADGK